MSTFPHDALVKYCLCQVTVGGAQNCETREFIFLFNMFYDLILFAQNRDPKAELQCTIWDKKEKKNTHYDQKQS